MADLLKARTPARTNTVGRRRANTDTPEPDVDFNLPVPPLRVLRIVSADKEHSTTPCRVGASLVAAPQDQADRIGALLVAAPRDQADAVWNTPDDDLLRHMRQMYWNIVQCVPPFQLTRDDKKYVSFRSKLIAALLEAPMEDGITHPAEELIDEALRAGTSDCRDWLSRVLVEHYEARPSISASIVRCVGRLEYDQVGHWGMHVADDALRHEDVEVREAAIRALEDWGGCEALRLLRSHRDSVAWLSEYVSQVIADLSETTW
jgi:hypothetical protein